MSPEQFDSLVEDTFSKLKKLIDVKGGEYAHDSERFENFIRNGKRLDLHRLTIWAVYFNKHVDAINSYIAGVQNGKIRESSEPIQGRFEDALVYLLLGLGMLEEDNIITSTNIQDKTMALKIPKDSICLLHHQIYCLNCLKVPNARWIYDPRTITDETINKS
jgi:hypothetical protein